MKVKELIEELKRFNPDANTDVEEVWGFEASHNIEVVTSDYKEIEKLYERLDESENNLAEHKALVKEIKRIISVTHKDNLEEAIGDAIEEAVLA